MWIDFSRVVWDGPPSLQFKHSLSRCYPSLELFFRQQLCINQPSLSKLLIEDIKTYIAGLGTTTLASEQAFITKRCIYEYLRDLSNIMRDYPASERDLSDLRGLKIFPVETPSQKIVLRASHERFYIPDTVQHSHLVELFRNQVDLLAFDAARICEILPLLEGKIFAPRKPMLFDSVVQTFEFTGEKEVYLTLQGQIRAKAQYIQRCLLFRAFSA